MRPLHVLLLWLALASLAGAQERHIYNYAMRHTLPEQVLPALNAQLSADSSITPYQQQLILNVTAQEYRTVTELLKQLDVAPRSLLITVRNQNQSDSQDGRYGVEGRIGTGTVQMQTGSGRPGDGRGSNRGDTRIDIDQSTRQRSGEGTQQIRALEGMAALISAGSVQSIRTDRYGNRELVPVTSGFYATVRIIGAEVVVDIDQHDDRVQGYSAQSRSIQTQGLQTQVRGRLGTWIALGALQSNEQGSGRNIAAYGGRSSTSSTDLAIKVDLAD